MHTLKTLSPVALLTNSGARANPQTLVEHFFWQTYQDCSRTKTDPRHASVNDLVQLVKSEPSPVAQALYRLSYAIFTYAITNETSYLEITVQACYTELESLHADYSLAQINKYLNKYTAQPYGLVSSN